MRKYEDMESRGVRGVEWKGEGHREVERKGKGTQRSRVK